MAGRQLMRKTQDDPLLALSKGDVRSHLRVITLSAPNVTRILFKMHRTNAQSMIPRALNLRG